MLTEDGVSSSVSSAEIIISLAAFGAIFLIVGTVWVVLINRAARADLPPAADPEADATEQPETIPTLTY